MSSDPVQTIKQDEKEAKASANEVTKIAPKPSEPGGITKKALIVCKETFKDIKEMYASQKSQIDSSLNMAPNVYNSAIAMMYTILQAPPTFFTRVFGTIPGAIFKMVYPMFFAGPYYMLMSALDFRTYKNFILTVMAFVTNCLPAAIDRIIKGIFQGLADMFNVVAKGVQGQKKLDSLKSRQMLTESKIVLMEGNIWNWVKGALYKVFDKIKGPVMWIIKTGWNAIEKPFMKYVYPLATCMSESNKMRGGIVSGSYASTAAATGAVNMLLGMLGLGTAFAGLVPMLAWFLVIMGTAAFMFTIAGYLSGAGQIIEMKNLVTDAFSSAPAA